MARKIVPFEEKKTPQVQMLLVGGVIGALAGLGAAYLFWQAREKRSQETEEEIPAISSGGIMKIGVLLFNVLRQIGDIGRGD